MVPNLRDIEDSKIITTTFLYLRCSYFQIFYSRFIAFVGSAILFVYDLCNQFVDLLTHLKFFALSFPVNFDLGSLTLSDIYNIGQNSWDTLHCLYSAMNFHPIHPETILVFWRSTCDNGKISRQH